MNETNQDCNSSNQEGIEPNLENSSVAQDNNQNIQTQGKELRYPALPPSYSSIYNVPKSCVCTLLKKPKHARVYESPECTSVSTKIIQQPENTEEQKSPRKKNYKTITNNQNQTQERNLSMETQNDDYNGNDKCSSSPENDESNNNSLPNDNNNDDSLTNNNENDQHGPNLQNESTLNKEDGNEPTNQHPLTSIDEANSVLNDFLNADKENEGSQDPNPENQESNSNEENVNNKDNQSNEEFVDNEEEINRSEEIAEISMKHIQQIQQKRKAQRNRIKAKLTGTEEGSHLRKEPFSMKLYKDNLEKLYPETRGTYSPRCHSTRSMAKTTGNIRNRSGNLSETNNDSFFTETMNSKKATIYRPSITSNQRLSRSCSCRTSRPDENNSILRSPILARSSNEFFASLSQKYTKKYTRTPYETFNMIECRKKSIESAKKMREDYNMNLINLRKIENQEHEAAVKLSYERETYHGDEMTHPFYPSLRIIPTHFRQSHQYRSKKYI